jgi:hypothetical protein
VWQACVLLFSAAASMLLWAFFFPSWFGFVAFLVFAALLGLSLRWVLHLWWLAVALFTAFATFEFIWAVPTSPLQDEVHRMGACVCV